MKLDENTREEVEENRPYSVIRLSTKRDSKV